jgi:threonine/homoserine/homoserine lactone efflux protein
MTPEQALAFFLFAVAAAGTPGPSNAMLTAVGANVGVRRGFPCLLGVAFGMGLMMFAVAFGFGSLILGHPAILRALRWCGAAFLCWLAWQIATAGGARAPVGGRPVSFIGAAAFQWINPKSWLVCASATATFLEEGAGDALGQSVAFGLVFVAASLPSCLPWLAVGAVLHRFLRPGRGLRIFNAAMGALLLASVILFVW